MRRLAYALFPLWAFAAAGATWIPLAPAGPSPPARMAHTAILDSQGGRIIVFGGASEVFGLLGDVWSLSLDAVPSWTLLVPAGTPPVARWDHVAVYDPLANRMVVFGGADASGLPRNDVWALSLADPMTWTEILPQGPGPAPRASHVAVLDPAGNRVLVHGGFDGSTLRGDLWELSLDEPPAWRLIEPDGDVPIPRRDAVAVVDGLRSRAILHGGNGGFAPFLNDSWALDLATLGWTELQPASPPDGAITHAGAYDGVRDRFVLFGGNYHNETWQLPLAGSLAWQMLLPGGPLPAGRIDHTLVHDPSADRFIAFGGHTGLMTLDDTWILDARDPAAAVHEVGGPGLWAAPNPATARVAFSLRGAAAMPDAEIAVYDVSGRVVRMIAVRAGDLEWDLRDTAGRRVAAGTYFCRVNGVQSAGAGVARVVVRR